MKKLDAETKYTVEFMTADYRRRLIRLLKLHGITIAAKIPSCKYAKAIRNSSMKKTNDIIRRTQECNAILRGFNKALKTVISHNCRTIKKIREDDDGKR